jgi:spermidine synthase
MAPYPSGPFMSKRVESFLFLSFFLSGTAAVIHQTSWLRLAGLYFEGTAIAAATVVAIFMAGLALGGYLAGRLARRSRDLTLLYFSLQALIGLLALAVPWLMAASRPLFARIYADLYGQPFLYHLMRIALSAVVMLPATVLMGLTLPILVEALTGAYSGLGKRAGSLYGVNAAGAALGAAVAGFTLLPHLGTLRTILVGAAINLSMAVVGWVVLRRFPWMRSRRANAQPRRVAAQLPTRAFILVAFTLSGFCALCYEITWTRLLVASLGPASSTFAVVLCCFLLGLAIGSSAYAALSSRIGDRVLPCGILLLLTGLAAAATTLLLPRLPVLAGRFIADSSGSYGQVTAVKYLLAGTFILPLTVFSGALFPAAAAAYVPDAERLSERIGRLYAGNSMGSIVGSLAAGFVLLPLLGAHRAALPVIIVQFLVGLYIVTRSRSRRLAGLLVPIPVAAVIALVLLPGADPRLLFGGSFGDFMQYGEGADAEMIAAGRPLLYHKDGQGGTVTVMGSLDGTRTFLAVDGMDEGSSDAADMVTQTMLAHLPLVLHPEPTDVLVIGLGTGTTFAATLRYPVESSVCVEISPQIVEAAKLFRSFYEGISIEDERAEVVIGDGRSFLFFSPRSFDVIIAQPSNPWLSGMGNLYTREYFGAMRDRLRAGGIACQWIQGYRLSPHTFKSIIKTYASVFPHVSLWWLNITGGDFLLLGSDEAYRFSVDRLAGDIEQYGIRHYETPEDDQMTPYTFLRRFVAGDQTLRVFASDGTQVTDDSAFLEYVAAREFYVSSLDMLHLELIGILATPGEVVGEADLARPEVVEQLARYDDNRRQFIDFIYTDQSDIPWASPRFLSKKEDWAGDKDVAPVLGRSLISYAERLYAASPYAPGSEEQVGLAYRIFRGYMEAFELVEPTERDACNVAHLYRDMGDFEGALNTVNEAIRRHFRSAAIYQIKGEVLYAIASRQITQAQGPEVALQVTREGLMSEARRNLQEAFTAFEAAARGEPSNPAHWLNMGVVKRLLGDTAAAREYWQKALEVDPENLTARRFLDE